MERRCYHGTTIGGNDNNNNNSNVIITNNKNNKQRVTLSIDSDGIAHVQLNRPDKLNALDLDMFQQLADVARSLSGAAEFTSSSGTTTTTTTPTTSTTQSFFRTDPIPRVVIVSGKGRAFCTGLDVKGILRNAPHHTVETLLSRANGEIANLAQSVGYQWRNVPCPVIAVLHGMCYGGGLQIALGADLRYATPECQFSIMEAKWGLIPDMSASVTLRELVRMDVAKELTMTGRIFSGAEAMEYGLITRCVPDPYEEARRVAKEIIHRSPDSVALSKQLYQQTWVNASEEYSLRLESELQRSLLLGWNQIAAVGRNFGLRIPYFTRRRRKVVVPPPSSSSDPSKTDAGEQ